MKRRILITDGLSSSGIALLKKKVDVTEMDSAMLSGEFDALIVRSRTKVGPQVIESGGSRLSVVGRAGVGVDNIDLAAAKKSGVVVVNAPEALTLATAELTLGLMLALARKIPFADATTRGGAWRKKDLVGTQLHGKTLGIIGVGRIGTAIARRAVAFGMTVLGFDPHLSSEEVGLRGAIPVTRNELLTRADYISLNLSLSEDTYHLINQGALEKMKTNARIISTSRGGIIDEEALFYALETKRIAGAALDVFEHEPPQSNALLAHKDFISTPHIGAQTEEAQSQVGIDIAEEVLAALAGEPLRWRVV
jgi:D-3-phosphoglycerate dehydrogenase